MTTIRNAGRMPAFTFLNKFFAQEFLPKTPEVFRGVKLTSTTLEMIPFLVPRRSTVFQDDLFPETLASKESCSVATWRDRADEPLPLFVQSLNPVDGGRVRQVGPDERAALGTLPPGGAPLGTQSGGETSPKSEPEQQREISELRQKLTASEGSNALLQQEILALKNESSSSATGGGSSSSATTGAENEALALELNAAREEATGLREANTALREECERLKESGAFLNTQKSELEMALTTERKERQKLAAEIASSSSKGVPGASSGAASEQQIRTLETEITQWYQCGGRTCGSNILYFPSSSSPPSPLLLLPPIPPPVPPPLLPSLSHLPPPRQDFTPTAQQTYHTE